jgi:hypothetical protein
LFEILNYSVWYAIHVNFIFFCLFWNNVQYKRTHKGRTRGLLVVRGPQFEKRCLKVFKQYVHD